MASKNKARKPHTRRQFSLINAMLASPTHPMPIDKQIYQLGLMRLSLDAMERSAEPSHNDWRNVSDAINLLETFLEMGYIEDAQGLLKDAVFTMGQAGQRVMQGKALRLSGAGIQACRAVLDDYAMVLAALPERTVINAFIQTERRIAAIQTGHSQSHDVQIVAI